MKNKLFLLLSLLALACSATAYTPITATETRTAPTPAQLVSTEKAMLATCTVTAFETLNLRASPGTAEAVKAVLSNGDQLTILPDPPQGAWIHVRAGDLTGWINSKYCKGN